MRRRGAMLCGVVAAAGLVAAASPAPAYVPNTLDFLNGVAVVAHWAAGAFPVAFQVTPGLTTDVSGDADRAALEAAMQTWSSVADSTASIFVAGESQVEANVFDGINAIEFSNDSALQGAGFIALTFLTTEPDGTIVETDILVNDREIGFTTTEGSRVGLDLETAMLRELGKALGLASSPMGSRLSSGTLTEETAVMYPVGRGIGEAARALRDDDVAGISALYPSATSRRGSIAGTVTRAAEPVFGAHVVVFDPVEQTLVGAVSLPDGSFRIAGLPPGRYFLEVLPLAQPATAATLGGIFVSDLVDSSFRRVFWPEVIRLGAGGSVSGIAVGVQ